MTDLIEDLKQKTSSKVLAETVMGVKETISLIDQLTDILTTAIKQSENKFIVTENASMVFNNYIEKLKSFVSLQNECTEEVQFWAASLLTHYSYSLKSSLSEEVLLKAVISGELEKSYPATVLLVKIRSSKIESAIKERLKDSSLSGKAITFFEEKLQELLAKSP